jgi:hypothetical protein
MGLIASWTGRLLALALVLVLVAPGARAQQACQAVADGLRSGISALAYSPARTIAKADAAEIMRSEFHATPRLVEAIKSLAEYSVDLQRFGESSLRMAVSVQGSAGCQFIAFFATAPDGTSDLIEGIPPILRDKPEGSLLPCSGAGSLAHAGTAGGEPSFIVDIGADQNNDFNITPWRNGTWQKACTVAVHYSATFTVTDRSCNGVDCAKVSELARDLAMKLDSDPNSLPPMSKPGPALTGPSELPTFRPVIDHETFASKAIATPVTFEGQQYIARIGHRAIGWRTFPDYLVGLYRQPGAEIEPVAGIFIEKKRDKPADIVIK